MSHRLLAGQGLGQEDIKGAIVYGLHDEKLGKIHDVIFDPSTGHIDYVVVDTGGWLTTKEFLVPSDHLRLSNEHEGDFASDLTKERIESFPPYEKSALESPEQWADYDKRYRSKWESDPVMHRVGTDRNITPTTEQLQGNRSSILASDPKSTVISVSDRLDKESLDAASRPADRIVPEGRDTVVISSSAVGIGPRWDTFQEKLRERRKTAAVAPGVAAPDAITTGREHSHSDPTMRDQDQSISVPTKHSDIEQIRGHAYQIYLKRGGAYGFELEDWLKAEAEFFKKGSVCEAA